MSQAPTREAVHLKDYRPPSFLTPTVELAFELAPEATIVTSRQEFRRTPDSEGLAQELVLFGEAQELLELRLDKATLPPEQFRLEGDRLVLPDPPAAFLLEVKSRIAPQANTTLMGLYLSNGIFCTQCEPEGFRRITYFQD